jgi:hypothetical protein
MSGTYKECPNQECQGLIAPDFFHVTNWEKQPKAKNIFRMVRHHYLWCANCGTAFHLVEDQYFGNFTSCDAKREKDFPVQAGKIKKHIPAFQLQTV